MKKIALLLAILMVVTYLPTPVAALDLTIQDSLHGTRVAASTVPQGFEDNLVTHAQLNSTIARERDKTNDTLALVAFGLLLLVALNHADPGSDDGDDGKDDKPHPRPCITF